MHPTDSERRLLTILFADLSGFTSLSSKLDPEEVSDVANTSFEFLNRAITAQGGTIHKYEGDLVIALFGFPTAHEDDPERAIKASFEMMRLVPKINETLSKKLKTKTNLGLHVGINSGIVYVGEVGSVEKKEHTIMGDAVNLCSRLKDIAKMGEIIVSEPVFRASRYLFDYEVMPAAELKGIREPVKVFKPLKTRDNPEPKRGIAGLYSPMVGREGEFSLLIEAVARLRKGQGGVFFILGDAGLGKSRLLTELSDALARERSDLIVLEGRCFSYGENIPYLPFMQILEKIFDVNENDSLKSFKEKVVDRTKEIAPETWEEIAPYIGYMFSLRFTDDLDMKVKYLDAQGLKTQITLSIKKLLAAFSKSKPILLIFEDYHWIDNESLELLESIFGVPGNQRIMLLGLSRIEKDKPCYKTKETLRQLGHDSFQEVVLKPLGIKAATQLVYNLLKIPGITEGFKDKILTQAEGNPFYAEEIIRSLIDSGVLVYVDGVWKLTTNVSSIKIPDSVQAVIATRLDRLEQETKNILQVASVIGRNFYGRILEQLCEVDNLMLVLHLATLEDFDYIIKREQKPEMEYAFRHPLLTEVIYNSLVKKRRRELHRKTGEIIEQLYPERTDELTEILAYQYGNSDNYDKALEWTVKAGKKAKARYANDEAIKYFQNAVTLITEGMAGGKEYLFEAQEALGGIYSLKGEYDGALKCYAEMYDSAGGNKVKQARAKMKTASIHEDKGNINEALKILDEAEALLAADNDDELIEKARINFMRSSLHREKGLTREAIADSERGLEIVAGLKEQATAGKIAKSILDEVRVHGLSNLGAVYIYTSDYDRALELFAESAKITDMMGDKARLVRQMSNLGIIHLYKGEYKGAIEIWERAMATTIQIGDKGHLNNIYGNLGIAYGDIGDDDKAIEFHEKALQIAEEIGDKRPKGAALVNLGTIYSSRGEYEKAVDHYRRSMDVKKETGDRHGYAIAVGNLGSIYESWGKLTEALKCFEEAMKIFEEVGDRRFVSTASLMIADHWRLLGDHVKALEYCLKPLEVFKSIGDKHGMGMAQCCAGGIYTDAGDLEKAKSHLEEAEKILDEVGEISMQMTLYNSLALLKIIMAEKDPSQQDALAQSAKKYIDTVLGHAKKQRARVHEGSCYHLYGKLFSLTGDVEKAGENFKKAIKIFEELKDNKILPDIYFDYAKMLKKGGVGATKTAEEYFEKALKIFQELGIAHKVKQVRESR